MDNDLGSHVATRTASASRPVKKMSTADPKPTLTGAPRPEGGPPQSGPPHDAALQAALEAALRHRDFTASDVTDAVSTYARQARARGVTPDQMLEALNAQLERALRPRTRTADYEVIAPYLARRAVRAYHQPR